MQKQLPVAIASHTRNIVSLGADLGAKTVFLLSAVYATLVLVGFGICGLADSYVSGIFGLYAIVLIPVLLIGTLTGAILGWLSGRLSGVISRQRFIRLGILVCIILLATLHLIIFTSGPLLWDEHFEWPFVPSMSLGEYWLMVGFPGIVYLIDGAWISHVLWLKT